MIICGIIQSPQKNSDLLIVRQIAGKKQSPDSIINAKIDLTDHSPCIDKNGIECWRRGKKSQKELYLCATTNSKDFLERPILLGIYLEEEKGEVVCIPEDFVINLLKEFSLEMDKVMIGNVSSLVKDYFTKPNSHERTSFFIVICIILLFVAIVYFLLKSNIGG